MDQTGVGPAEVARRAGHSIAVLCRFYARLLRGLESRANQLIDEAFDEPPESESDGGAE